MLAGQLKSSQLFHGLFPAQGELAGRIFAALADFILKVSLKVGKPGHLPPDFNTEQQTLQPAQGGALPPQPVPNTCGHSKVDTLNLTGLAAEAPAQPLVFLASRLHADEKDLFRQRSRKMLKASVRLAAGAVQMTFAHTARLRLVGLDS
ncbi:MAG: hypothetical protein U0931_29030 [Vulcanimicrobiota bacterium]